MPAGSAVQGRSNAPFSPLLATWYLSHSIILPIASTQWRSRYKIRRNYRYCMYARNITGSLDDILVIPTDFAIPEYSLS
jgi:hypothetical protein